MDAEKSRLRWHCRRGMRELDIVVTRYLDQRYDTADNEERAAFTRLLDLPDPQLLGFLTGREAPPDADLRRIVDVIKTLGNAGH